MKQTIIIHASEPLKIQREVDQHAPNDRRYTYQLQGEMRSPSDGYHTFNELYDHRITLFIALAKHYQDLCKVAPQVILNTLIGEQPIVVDAREVWRSKQHHVGGEPMYEGWFVMGIGTEKGKQVSYHLPIDRWDETMFAETVDNAPEWDGHTPSDVITRLKNL